MMIKAHTFNPSIRETDRVLSYRPAWCTEQSMYTEVGVAGRSAKSMLGLANFLVVYLI